MTQEMKDKDPHNAIRVCFFGTYREEYSRNRILMQGLKQNGVQVIECHESLWRGSSDRVDVANRGWLKLKFWRRVVTSYWRVFQKFRKIGDFDILLVGYPGALDVFFAKFASRIRRTPLCWDMFMSIFLISQERKIDALSQYAIRSLENIACNLPNMIIIDTEQYAEWLHQEYTIPRNRIRLVPTGADEKQFKPLPSEHEQDLDLNVLYYGTFIPNHGLEYILGAANILKDYERIRFSLIGEGPEKSKVRELIKRYDLANVNLEDWVPEEDLVHHIQRAHIVLGAFGKTPQSIMTIQNKIYQGLAMNKVIITGNSPSIQDNFTHGVHIYSCIRANKESLAQAIEALWRDPDLRHSIAQNGHALFLQKYTSKHIGNVLKSHLQELLRCSVQG